MTSPALKLVPDSELDRELKEIAAEMADERRELIKRNGKAGDVLPPIGARRYDDLANSAAFLEWIGDDMLYCAESGKWLIWQETHWKEDRDDFVFEYAAKFARSLYDEADDKEAFKNAQRANNKSGFTAFLDLARRKKTTTIETFDDKDRTGRLLNFRNGTLDLQSGNLRAADKSDRITRCVRFDYDADAKAPAFDAFLKRIQPDPDIRAFLQRSIGYSLLGEVRERAFWILYGTGKNGKSVFTNLFNNLLGQYASTTTTASIMAGRQNSIPNDIARLKGKRFIVVPETEENERINAALVKALSAGDKVSARFLFGEFFDFYFSGKLWIATNHKPTVTDASDGFWDRVKLVPFNERIPADEAVKIDDLIRKMMSEASGVLAWAVQGARDYFEMDDLDVPAVIQAEIDAYRKEQDSIAQFIEEHCQTIEQARELRPEQYIIAADFQVKNSDLYEAYKTFCTANGEYLRSHRRLTQNMHERGFRQVRTTERYWQGIRLINPVGPKRSV